MTAYSEGDIVTLGWQNDRYLVAKIVYIENLTLHELIHVLVYDTLLDAGPAGYDIAGEYVERTHDVPDIDSLPVVIDHFALTLPAFEACDPIVVGKSEVTEEDKRGYIVWVAMRRAQAERRGMIRHDIGEDDDEEFDDEEWAEDEEVEQENVEEEDWEDEGEEEESKDDRDDAASEVGEGEEEESEYVTIKPHTWHDTYFDHPISQALVELSDIFTQEEFADSLVGKEVLAQTEASAEEIDGLIRQLVEEGDYGAGQDLLMYGEPAANKLYEALRSAEELQTVEDILQILGDMGNERAYAHVAEFFAERVDRLPADDVAVAAARSFCYVVMLTGGAPEPLRDRLKLLERLDYPDLREDAENAIDAIHRQGVEITDPTVQSNDPFSSLGG